MAGIYEELGIRPFINAAGTYTAIGGSRMSEGTLQALCEASRDFVPMEALQAAINRRIAELTRNEAACVCNSCSTAMYLAAAACAEWRFGRASGAARGEAVALWGQHIPYDHALEQAGVRLRFAGYPNLEAPLDAADVEQLVNENTVLFYFAPRTPDGHYGPGCMNFQEFAAIAHRHHLPILADCAAQLPPKSNLWRFTRELGADMACFSGGKDLRGPQASGLLVGRREWVDRVTRLSFPRYGDGRIMKMGREEMVALYHAVQEYVEADEDARLRACEDGVEAFVSALADAAHLRARRTWPNQAGQPLPRIFVELHETACTAEELRRLLAEGAPAIFCFSENRPGVFINPMCMTAEELAATAARLREIDQQLPNKENPS